MLPARDFAASARGYAQINHGRSDTRDLSLTDALALFSFLLRQWLARCLLRRRTQCPRDHRRRLRSNGRWSRRNFLPVPSSPAAADAARPAAGASTVTKAPSASRQKVRHFVVPSQSIERTSPNLIWSVASKLASG